MRNITARYQGTKFDVLHNVNVDLYPGQTLAVVGESGSGKSTLARVITGLLPPREGEIYFNGRTLTPDFKHRSREDLRELQMIYQMADGDEPTPGRGHHHRPPAGVLLRPRGSEKQRSRIAR